jgi:hypothetical protein
LREVESTYYNPHERRRLRDLRVERLGTMSPEPQVLPLHLRQLLKRQKDLWNAHENDIFNHCLAQSSNHMFSGLGCLQRIRLEDVLIERSDVGLLVAGD